MLTLSRVSFNFIMETYSESSLVKIVRAAVKEVFIGFNQLATFLQKWIHLTRTSVWVSVRHSSTVLTENPFSLFAILRVFDNNLSIS